MSERSVAIGTLIFSRVRMLVLKLYIDYGRHRLQFALKNATGSLSDGGSLSGPYPYECPGVYPNRDETIRYD